jgi:hypothetical protein
LVDKQTHSFQNAHPFLHTTIYHLPILLPPRSGFLCSLGPSWNAHTSKHENANACVPVQLRHCRRFILANHAPEMMFTDAMSEDFLRLAVRVSLLVSGFPCQPFSCQGSRFGFDELRGQAGSIKTKYCSST